MKITIEPKNFSWRQLVLKLIALKPFITWVSSISALATIMNLCRRSRSSIPLFQTATRLFTRLLMSTNLLAWGVKLSNGITFSLPKWVQILKSLPRWAIYINRNRTNSRPSTSIKSHTVTTLQKLMWFPVSVCTMPSKICLKKLFFTSKGQVRSSPRRSSGS